MNANPRVVVEEAVATTIAKATLVVEAVAEPARSTERTRIQSVIYASTSPSGRG